MVRPGRLILLLLLAAPALADVTGAPRVIDGDSLRIGAVEVRLWGIDAPEWDQTCRRPGGEEWKCGQAATERMRVLVAGATVTCSDISRDRYKRVIGRCLVKGRDIGRQLVIEGLAVAYTRYSDHYLADETAARESGAGIWATEFVTPEKWRHSRPHR